MLFLSNQFNFTKCFGVFNLKDDKVKKKKNKKEKKILESFVPSVVESSL